LKTLGLNIKLAVRVSNALGRYAKSRGWSKSYAAADILTRWTRGELVRENRPIVGEHFKLNK